MKFKEGDRVRLNVREHRKSIEGYQIYIHDDKDVYTISSLDFKDVAFIRREGGLVWVCPLEYLEPDEEILFET